MRCLTDRFRAVESGLVDEQGHWQGRTGEQFCREHFPRKNFSVLSVLYLVGGLDFFFHMLGMSSSQLTFSPSFFRGVAATTKQQFYYEYENYIELPWFRMVNFRLWFPMSAANPHGFFATSSGGPPGVAAVGLHRSAICRDGSDVESKTRQGHFRCLAQDYRFRIVG